MSNTVTASGMKVRAVTDGSLLIAFNPDVAPADSAFLVTASANMTDAAALKPASTVNLTDWATTSAASRTATAAQSAARTSLGSGISNYVLTPNSFWLYSENPTYVYLSGLSIKQNGNPVNLGWNGTDACYFFDCLRVGIKCGSEWYIYAPSAQSAGGGNSATADTTIKGDSWNGTAWDVVNLSKAEVITAATGTGTSTNHCGIVASNVKTRMEVYIWFEGEDGACYTNNIDLNGVEVSIELKSASLTQTQQKGTISTTATVVDSENYYQIGTSNYYVESTTAAVGADVYTIDTGHAVKSALYIYGGES